MDTPILIFESGVGAVAAGSYGGGWVSGNPASLAASSNVNVVFDLGARWDERPVLHVVATNAGPGTPMAVTLKSSDTTTASAARALRDNVGSALRPIADSVTAVQTTGSYLVRPLGRYLIVNVANGDASNAFSAAAKVVVGAFPC